MMTKFINTQSNIDSITHSITIILPLQYHTYSIEGFGCVGITAFQRKDKNKHSQSRTSQGNFAFDLEQPTGAFASDFNSSRPLVKRYRKHQQKFNVACVAYQPWNDHVRSFSTKRQWRTSKTTA